jgi:hypothetical protein
LGQLALRGKCQADKTPLDPAGFLPWDFTPVAPRSADRSMIFGPMPFLLIFFAVAMGVNDGKKKDNHPANQHNDDYGLITPDIADKLR